MKVFYKIMAILFAVLGITICIIRLYEGESSGASDTELIILLLQVILGIYLLDSVSRD